MAEIAERLIGSDGDDRQLLGKIVEV